MTVSLDTNALAQQIKNASLNDDSHEASDVTSGHEDDQHRVYIGNLSFETTEDEIKKQFSQSGEVVSITLPKKRNSRAKSARPAAIAFVGYTSDADAQKAVEMLNGKTIGEREITVAIARPLTKRSKSASQTNGIDQTKSKAAPEKASEDNATTAEDGKQSKKKSRKSRSKKQPDGTINAPAAETTNSSSDGVNGGSKAPASRLPRERGPPSDGVPSSTTLFVAGLDHKTTDAELKELFSSFQPVSAHVALRPIQRYMIRRLAEKGEQRLGRGFGFVTFADQAAQTKALNAMNGHTIGERELAVKVAIDSAAEKEKSQQTPPTGLEKSVHPAAVESDTA